MKKWYFITGILALLLVISISTCSGNSDKVDGLKEARSSLTKQLADTKAELADTKAELAGTKAIKKIDFDEGLCVSEINLPKGYVSSLTGKVQNISSEPMELVYIVVVAYNEDGSIEDLDLAKVRDLYPDEVGDWTVWPGGAANYSIHAVGNR